ncbi:MAG: RNA methyltransferase [Flavobacteriaceae bacterium]|nr:RNA methyltransferase [Flavobacteriaceae bacterium]
MISKSQISLLKKLQLKKYRAKTRLFVAEGQKVVDQCIDQGLTIHRIYSTDWRNDVQLELINAQQMHKISNFKTPSSILGIFEMPPKAEIETQKIDIVIDRIQDPGNLGTIIRLCDWFGFRQLICSEDSVDCYNPKVIQASMGSFCRVNCHYTNLLDFLSSQNKPVYGTSPKGDSMNDFYFEESFILLFGNESQGISKNLHPMISQWISIDKFSKHQAVDSLNVASTVGICLYKIRNRESHFKK